MWYENLGRILFLFCHNPHISRTDGQLSRGYTVCMQHGKIEFVLTFCHIKREIKSKRVKKFETEFLNINWCTVSVMFD